MKKIIIMIASALVLSLGATATVGIVTSNKTYTTVETDAFVTELQKQIDDKEADFDAQIKALTKQYQDKDAELLASIESNKKALDELDNVYYIIKCEKKSSHFFFFMP